MPQKQFDAREVKVGDTVRMQIGRDTVRATVLSTRKNDFGQNIAMIEFWHMGRKERMEEFTGQFLTK